jgi:hypothetical protein
MTHNHAEVLTEEIPPNQASQEQYFLDAVLNQDIPTVRRALAAGVNIEACNAQGKTALILASHNGNMAIVKGMLRRGANISHRDAAGKSALDYAVMGQHDSIVKLLDPHYYVSYLADHLPRWTMFLGPNLTNTQFIFKKKESDSTEQLSIGEINIGLNIAVARKLGQSRWFLGNRFSAMNGGITLLQDTDFRSRQIADFLLLQRHYSMNSAFFGGIGVNHMTYRPYRLCTSILGFLETCDYYDSVSATGISMQFGHEWTISKTSNTWTNKLQLYPALTMFPSDKIFLLSLNISLGLAMDL